MVLDIEYLVEVLFGYIFVVLGKLIIFYFFFFSFLGRLG